MNLIVTRDGSNTIELGDSAISYHSRHGAIAESSHVYINAGLEYFYQQFKPATINIFEMGFGTGLNALLTYQFAKAHNIEVHYTALDLFPVEAEIYKSLNFATFGNLTAYAPVLQLMHQCHWNEPVKIDTFFTIEKIQFDILSFIPRGNYDLVFYDAFSPSDRPDHWTEAIFKRIYIALKSQGVFVTYSSKSTVRRALRSAGFMVKKLPGPYGKREIVRALKA